MAQDKQDIKATYPLPSYNYRVTVGSDVLSFSEVSGLSVEHEPVTYKHGPAEFIILKFTHKLQEA